LRLVGEADLQFVVVDKQSSIVIGTCLLLALGFTKEGLFRQRWLTKGEIQDSNIYGLLCDEWVSCV